MDRLRSIEAFVRVAETQSFAKAARQLGVAKSVVTTRVQQLEEFVHTPLLHRTTRSVTLSETGAAFYRECADLVDRSSRLVDQMRELHGAPTGTLRVHALPGFALGHFGEILRTFQELHPGIVLDLVVSDDLVNPAREGFDCVLQIFEPVSDALVVRHLFAWRPVFCASPVYLAAHGAPATPAALRDHRLGLYSRYPTRDRWVFEHGGERTSLELKPVLRTNSVHLLRDYAVAGAGIVCIPTLVACEHLLDGELVALLPAYGMPAFWLSAAYPVTAARNLRLRVFLDALAAKPASEPPWDQALIARGMIRATAPAL